MTTRTSLAAALLALATLAAPAAAQLPDAGPAARDAAAPTLIVRPVDARLVPTFDGTVAIAAPVAPSSLVAASQAAAPLGAALAATAAGASSGGGRSVFSSRDLVYWGTAALAGVALYQLDASIARAVPDSVDRANGGLDYAAVRLSAFNEYTAAYIALGIYGSGRILGKEHFAEMGAHAIESALLGKLGMDLGRGLAGRSRPITQRREGREFDKSDFKWRRGFDEVGYGAFPSRHVTGVSAVTSVLAFETMHHWPQHSKWVTPLAIAVPLAVGSGRVYTNNHWATDILAGGALGTWLGWKTVRATHNHPNNWVDRVLLGKRD